jgi:hypothetical protein
MMVQKRLFKNYPTMFQCINLRPMAIAAQFEFDEVNWKFGTWPEI